MRIGLFCGEAAGARILQDLTRSVHEVAVVLAEPGTPLWALAGRLGYRPIAGPRVRDPHFAAQLADANIDLILNVHSLYLVPDAVLAAARLGAYNLHPGPLPRYAGLNAPSWAIYQGEQRHGVTVHHMAPGIDTGDIAYQDSFAISSDDTGLSLALRCVEKGLALLHRLLDDAVEGCVPRLPQDPAHRSYFGRGTPQGGRISWDAPARRIYDFVRACDYHPFASPWGALRARLGDLEVAILKLGLTGDACDAAPGTVDRDLSGATRVASGDEWLSVRRLVDLPAQ